MAQLILPKKRLDAAYLEGIDCVDSHYITNMGDTKQGLEKKRQLMTKLEKNTHDKIKERQERRRALSEKFVQSKKT